MAKYKNSSVLKIANKKLATVSRLILVSNFSFDIKSAIAAANPTPIPIPIPIIGNVKKTASYDSIEILVANRLSIKTKIVDAAVAKVKGSDIFPSCQKWVLKFFKVYTKVAIRE